MARLIWGAVGDKTYETGVDRGVLYVTGTGVPWNGLISVTESPTGGEPKEYYIDGVKYLSVRSLEQFEGTIEAFTYPDAFAECDGTATIANGLLATQQSRKSFNMSYRSRVGNDVEALNYGYKIHLVYNATAAPSSQTRTTTGESVEATPFTWELTTTPPAVAGYNPTAHFVIDSTKTPSRLLETFESILYGTETSSPRIPGVQELIAMFKNYRENGPVDPTDPVFVNPTPVTQVLDAGTPAPSTSPSSDTLYDGGTQASNTTSIIDGGTL